MRMKSPRAATPAAIIFHKCFQGTPAMTIIKKHMAKMIAVVEKSAGRMSARVLPIIISGHFMSLNSEMSLGFENHLASQTNSANEAKAEV